MIGRSLSSVTSSTALLRGVARELGRPGVHRGTVDEWMNLSLASCDLRDLCATKGMRDALRRWSMKNRFETLHSSGRRRLVESLKTRHAPPVIACPSPYSSIAEAPFCLP